MPILRSPGLILVLPNPYARLRPDGPMTAARAAGSGTAISPLRANVNRPSQQKQRKSKNPTPPHDRKITIASLKHDMPSAGALFEGAGGRFGTLGILLAGSAGHPDSSDDLAINDKRNPSFDRKRAGQ